MGFLLTLVRGTSTKARRRRAPRALLFGAFERGLGRVELPPPFFATKWQEDITANERHLQVETLSHDPDIKSFSEPWRPMDRRRHHHRGTSLGRVPRPQKEALTHGKQTPVKTVRLD